MTQAKSNGHNFSLGRVVITCSAERNVPPSDVQLALRRHHFGDRGEVPLADWKANVASMNSGGRLLSSYIASNGVKFWIITEADREATTVLLPEDY
jgi:hypothetical protein